MFSRAYKTVVTVPPLAWVAFFLLVPYLLMFCYSFWSLSPAQTIVHSWELANYKELFEKSVYWETLLRSLWIAARVMLFSLLLGYPLAYFLSFYAGKRKDLLYQMVIIPLWVSYLVRAYAWKTILGSDGVLNTFFEYVHLTNHRQHPHGRLSRQKLVTHRSAAFISCRFKPFQSTRRRTTLSHS